MIDMVLNHGQVLLQKMNQMMKVVIKKMINNRKQFMVNGHGLVQV